MVKKRPTFTDWLQSGVIRAARVQFALVALYAGYTIASDATHLINPSYVLQRWSVNLGVLAGSAVVWYLARSNTKRINYYRSLLYCLVLLDIGLATFNVYSQRGMASRAIVLYAVPIILSAILLSRVAIVMTATLSIAAYSLAAVKYFVDYFNEGYKAELYIEVGFYCGVFLLLASLLSIIVRFKQPETDLSL